MSAQFSDRTRSAPHDFKSFDAEIVFGAIQSLTETVPLLAEPHESEVLVSGKLTPRDILNHLKSRIVRVYSLDVRQDAHDLQSAYMALLTALDQAGCLRAPLDVFTTNYDSSAELVFRILPDTLLHEHPGLGHAETTDGFLDNPGAREWCPDLYAKKPIRVYKLHGSVSWKWKVDGPMRKVVDTRLPDPNPSSDCLLYFGYKTIPEEDPFRYLHDCLADALRHPAVVVVVGFRVADAYIRHLFKTALQLNQDIRMIFLLPDDPLPQHVANLLQHFGDRVGVATCRFGAPNVTEQLTVQLERLLPH